MSWCLVFLLWFAGDVGSRGGRGQETARGRLRGCWSGGSRCGEDSGRVRFTMEGIEMDNTPFYYSTLALTLSTQPGTQPRTRPPLHRPHPGHPTILRTIQYRGVYQKPSTQSSQPASQGSGGGGKDTDTTTAPAAVPPPATTPSSKPQILHLHLPPHKNSQFLIPQISHSPQTRHHLSSQMLSARHRVTGVKSLRCAVGSGTIARRGRGRRY